MAALHPSIHWIEGWMGPTAGQDAVEEKVCLAPARNVTPAVQPTASHYSDCAIPAPSLFE
jgi:hypothetical protein